MEQIEQKIGALEVKIDELTVSINKIKNIFYWILVVSIVAFVLPLIGLVFAIPKFIAGYADISGL